MNLHAILCWYDESPTWLAGCVASLTRIGVDHLIAVDGRYPLFSNGSPTCSRPEQVDAITSTAIGAGMALTVHRISSPMAEPEKRTRAFQLLNATADYGDWALVIDADEIVSEGDASLRDELDGIDAGTHVAACRVTNSVDPYAQPGADNDLTSKTLELHQKMPIAAEFAARQSRLWRVLDDMRVDTNHYTYTGVDERGKRWNLRGDIGTQSPEVSASPIHIISGDLTIQHRKNHRTAERRTLKRDYYTTRDHLGIERPE